MPEVFHGQGKNKNHVLKRSYIVKIRHNWNLKEKLRLVANLSQTLTFPVSKRGLVFQFVKGKGFFNIGTRSLATLPASRFDTSLMLKQAQMGLTISYDSLMLLYRNQRDNLRISEFVKGCVQLIASSVLAFMAPKNYLRTPTFILRN